MKKSRITILIISLLLVISIGLNIRGFLINTSTVANQNNYELNLEQYNKLVQSVNEQFKVEGYREILGHYSHALALPLNNNKDDLLSRQKLFVYKNSAKNSAVLLNISASKYNLSTNNEWNHSFDYLPKYFNSNKSDSQFKESYNPNLPPVQVATNSFNSMGCNLSLLAFANDNNQSIAAEELISFSNQLIDFMQKQIK